jgi:hypothetical protein
MAFIEKYLTAIKWGGLLLALAAWTAFIWSASATRVELNTAKTTNGQLQTQLQNKDQYLKEYQTLVDDNRALRDKLDVAVSQNNQLIQERQNANQAATLDLLSTLRDPARSVYAKDSNCGEAGSYPTVFGTSFGGTVPSTGNQLQQPHATVHPQQGR